MCHSIKMLENLTDCIGVWADDSVKFTFQGRCLVLVSFGSGSVPPGSLMKKRNEKLLPIDLTSVNDQRQL